MCFEKDAAKSVAAFEKFSAPVLKQFFGGDAQIHSYESSENPDEREFDLNYGIDGYAVDGDGDIHFYASRVQFGLKYETFTLRACRPSGTMTEIDKIRAAQKNHLPTPDYHVQTCVDKEGRGAAVAIVMTV